MTVGLPEPVTTPALVVDIDILQRNIEGMAQVARSGGFALRPHAKTHKSPAVARRQMEAGARGLSVATIGEAEALAAAGVDDLFIAYPLWVEGEKGRRLRCLAEEVQLSLGVDSPQGAVQMARAMRGAARPVSVLVEIDSGHHRSGVSPCAAAPVAAAAAEAGLAVVGVFTFPGHGYVPGERARAADAEGQALAEAAHAIGALGLNVEVLSGGSTPTVGVSTGSTEQRPGVYVFNDATQVALGSCEVGDVALVAAATVVSVPAADRFVLDAGSKTLAADRHSWQRGYGLLPRFPDAVITSLSEHHAVVRPGPDTRPPPQGSVVAVVPNHVCPVVNLADELLITRGGTVVDRWVVAARGANH